MKNNATSLIRCAAVISGVLSLGTAWSGVFSDITPGTAAPPPSIGGLYNWAPLVEARAEGTIVTSATAPSGGTLGFDRNLEVDYIGSLWSSWSHGYNGAVYVNFNGLNPNMPNSAEELTMTLPNGTLGLFFYAEPNVYDLFDFRAVTDNGVVVDLKINGAGGARYIGFYTDDPSDPLSFVYIRDMTNGKADGFAVGEFGFATTPVPEPSAYGLVFGALALGAAGCYRRFKK